jgi:gamma-glutamyltranspeptidase/glutathione hydrolase
MLPAATLPAIALIALLTALLVARPGASQTPGNAAAPPEAASGWHQHAAATGRRHMVAAANPLAVAVGMEVLQAGGSAVDAAVAVQMVLGLVEPQSSGLGGGAFLLHWDAATGRMVAYDGRETAPAAASPDRFLQGGRPMPFARAVKSPLSIGVPGTVRLMEHVHRRHGRLPWPRLLADAMRIAERGFPVSPRLNALLAASGPANFDAAARMLYFDSRGQPWRAGHSLVNQAYAETLRRLSESGARALYEGPVAEAIVAAAGAVPRGKGAITAADLAAYQVVEREPVCTPYRGNRVCSMGPPSSGAHAIGQALALLEPLSLGSGPADAMAPAAMHRMAEALKLAFGDRDWYVADPAFVAMPTGLLEPAYLAERRRLIHSHLARPLGFAGTPPGLPRTALGADDTQEAAGTSHVSIIDERGNAVALTTTIEAAFGSGRMAAGFLLNNELTDFSARPKDRDGRLVANRVEGGKRPRSSMSPTIVLGPDGRPLIVTGSAGGSLIIPYVLKTLVALIDWRLDPAAALALPNFASRGGPLLLETPQVGGILGRRHPADAISVVTDALRLKPLGHAIVIDAMTSGTQVIVRRPDGTLAGAADPRREGVAMGE